MALFAKNVPERRRASDGFWRVYAAFFQYAGHFFANAAGLADTGQVALDVGHEDRHADFREVLGHGLQGNRFTGARRAGDQAVAIGQAGQQLAGGGCVFCN